MWMQMVRFLIALCLLVGVSVAAASEPLRVCADPDNLPYTSNNSQTPGLYLDLAALLAPRLERQLEYFWWRNFSGGRSVRLTLLAGKCDLYPGLPDQKGAPYLLTEPFMQVGYAIVAETALALTGLDALHGKTVGVQFSSPPQNLLATQPDIKTVTFRYPEEAMDALDVGAIEAAFIWGPTAGYINRHAFNNRYQVVPIDGPDMQWRVAIAVRKSDPDLKTQLDRALGQLGPEIVQLAARYGLPQGDPQAIAPRSTARPDPSRALASQNPFLGNGQAAREGKSLFNQYCSRCHGPDAKIRDRRKNLTIFDRRHPDASDTIFLTTVRQGRPSKGMPPMGRALTETKIWKIKTFLNTVQKP